METFVIRLWRPGKDRGDDRVLRGVVEHIATGTKTNFTGGEQLIELLRAGYAGEDEAPVMQT